jgi:hypothetical protein
MHVADAMTRIVVPTRVLARAALILIAASLLAAPLAGVARAVVPPGLTITDPNRPMQPQHAFKCQKQTNKGVAKYLKTWSKTYAKCLGAIAACVQTKGSDSACLLKAADGCNTGIFNLGAFDLPTDTQAGSVLENTVTDFCRSLTLTELFDDEGGPRFSLITDACKNRFIQNLESCIFYESNCAAEKMLLVQMPRARDLLATAGVTVGNAINSPKSCLPTETGSGALTDAKAGKALLGCQKSADKAGVSFAAKARGAIAKCADAVMNCAQIKRTQKCVDSAAKLCTKQFLTVDDAQQKVQDAVTKACTKIPLNDLFDNDGGDVGALATVCSGVGVSSLATLADYASCIAKQERCQIEESITFTVPRINEFLTATGQSITLPSAFCPAP